MDLSEVGALLDPKPLPLETGYERLPSGALHVAVRTDDVELGVVDGAPDRDALVR